jgi:hypothetical protein
LLVVALVLVARHGGASFLRFLLLLIFLVEVGAKAAREDCRNESGNA